MGVLTFTCPRTEQPLTSDFSLDERTYESVRAAKAPIECPHCKQVHEFRIGEGRLQEAAPPT